MALIKLSINHKPPVPVMTTVKQYWPFVLKFLENKVSRSHYDTWFSSLQFESLEDAGRKVVVQVPSQFSANYLRSKYIKQIREGIQKYYPQVVHIDFKVSQANNSEEAKYQQEISFDSEKAESVVSKPNSVKVSSSFQPASSGVTLTKNLHNLNPKYTFETFITSSNNKLAANVAQAIIKNPGKQYNPVFLYSGVGLGKTHLLQAIGHQILEENPAFVIRYTTSETFFNLFLDSIKNKKTSTFHEFYRNADVLLIDDIQFIAGKEATQEAFFHTFNELHQNNKQIVITSDRHPKSLGAVEERLVSRFEWGMVVDISRPELEDRLSVLNFKLQQMKLVLPQAHVHRIAEAVNSNYRDLEGVLNRIEARMQLVPEKPLETYELEKILGGYRTSAPIKLTLNHQPDSPENILQIVAGAFSISKDELLGKGRQKHIALARQTAMYLIKENSGLSLPAVGKIFGRDHTTILHACRKVADLLGADAKFKVRVEGIAEQIG
jgi:chromosomal replication initiator protein